MRRCACPCGELLIGRAANAKYVNERHKQRAYRERVKRELEARGLPTTLSLKTANTANPTTAGNGDGEQRPRRATRPSGVSVRISYRRAVEALAAELDRHGVVDPPDKSRIVAETWLEPLLTDRQRAALHRRGA